VARSRITRDVQLAAVGIAAGLLGGLAMNLFARAAVAGRAGHGVQPSQAKKRPTDDAAVRVGAAAYRTVTGHKPNRAARRRLGVATHYAFSATLGLFYVLLVDRLPALAAGCGTFFGESVWAVADEGVMPALGLSKSPRQLPLGIHVYAVSGHAVFGATVEAVRRWARPYVRAAL
jgi:uncharacterized membrane protein YagU involved in acid resistance